MWLRGCHKVRTGKARGAGRGRRAGGARESWVMVLGTRGRYEKTGVGSVLFAWGCLAPSVQLR
jgi:hypothetical protein